MQLSKLIQKKKNLDEAAECFIICINYYEETPFQNNNYFYPKVAFYLAKTTKDISLMEENLIEDYEHILELLIGCLEYFKDNQDKEKIIDCYFELGDLFYKIKNYEKAYYYLNKGINLIEIMRVSLFNPIVKKKFFEKVNKLFELMILTCYNLDKIDDSLKFVELSKHRTFLDKVTENQKYKLIKPINPHLIKGLDDINLKIKQTLNDLKNFAKNGFKISSNYEKLSELKNQQEKCLNKIKNEFPEYYDYHYNNTFDYKKLNLKDRSLIEYYYTEKFLLIFLIENDKLIVEKIDFEDDDLRKLICDFEKQLEYYDSVKKTEEILNKLFNILIVPIKENISNDNLIIIPYKKLHNIPFNCLKYNNGNYLIDEYVITIMQSGSSIKYIENMDINPNRVLDFFEVVEGVLSLFWFDF